MSAKKLVYIVEDSTIIARILTNVISELQGVKAANFQTGEAMLNLLPKEKPNLILLDYYLDAEQKSSMNGAQIMLEIKRLFPKMQVILLTGMSDNTKLEELKTLGFSEILNKDADDIVMQVLECVKRHL